MPIYLLEVEPITPGKIMVDASSQAVAVNHKVKGLIKTRALTAKEVVDLMREGVQVETASPSPTHTEAPVTRSADVKAMDAAE